MKSVFIAFALLLMVLGFLFFSYRTLGRDTRQFLSQAQQITILCEQENYTQALEQAQALQEHWEHRSHLYYTFLPHDNLLHVSFSIQALIDYLSVQDKSMLTTESTRLQLYFQQILSDETFNADNIL